MAHENAPVNRIPHSDDDFMTEAKAQRIAAQTFEQLRRFPDRALAQIVIADGAVNAATRAMNLVPDRAESLPLLDVEQAARLVADAQKLLEATVLAARLAKKSWNAIGQAATGEANKKQLMLNRFGHLEEEWKAALIEPEVIDHEAWDGRGTVVSNVPDGLGWSDLGEQVARLNQFIAEHRPGRDLNLFDPSERLTDDLADYTWRLDTAAKKYGVANVPPALADDIDTRRHQTLARYQANLDAAGDAAPGEDEDGAGQ